MSKIGIVGGSEAFGRFLRAAAKGTKFLHFQSVREAAEAAEAGGFQALLLMPSGNDQTIPSLDWETHCHLARLRNAGQRVYIECCDAGDYAARCLFGFISDGPARGFFNENLVWQGRLMQARKGAYIPGRARDADVIVTVEDCLGSHTPVKPGTYRFPVIVEQSSFIYSAMRLSLFDRLTMLPHGRWRTLYGHIFSRLMGVDDALVQRAFDEVFPPVGLSPLARADKEGLEKAVRRAVDWHFHSGVMPDQSGQRGLDEMIRSWDLSVRANQRVDVILLTAALFVTAGAYFSDSALTARGEALADYGFRQGIQFEGGGNDGLFAWFVDGGAGPYTVYSSDNGRDALALAQLYRVTGREAYLNRLIRQGDLFLRWLDGQAYFKAASFDARRDTVISLTRSKPAVNAPVFYDGPVLGLSYLYRLTGDRRYFEAVCRTADQIARDYPNYETNYTPLTQNFLLSRLMMVLLTAQETGCGDYSARINEILAFFTRLQAPSGGVADHSLVDEKKSLAHAEFSIGMGNGHDRICDYLYCVNNLLGMCSLARQITRPCGIDMNGIDEMRQKLLDFVVKTQIRDADPRIDGGWMRAYDLEGGEYFGVNRDKDWGPYCVMGGWVMGLVPLALLGELGAPSVYSVR